MKNSFAIGEEIRQSNKMLYRIRRELNKMPNGKLVISRDSQGSSFYRVSKKNDTYSKERIKKDKVLVYRLARKAFLTELANRLTRKIELLNKLATKLPSTDEISVMGAMPKNFELLDSNLIINYESETQVMDWPNPSRNPQIKPSPLLLEIDPLEIDEWASLPYCENQSNLENKTHKTSTGILCRSKSEVALLELCVKLGYRFHYDEVVLCDGKRLSPDLILARDDGTLVYLEHRGMRGEDYDENNFYKDMCYYHAGLRQWDNYLITADDANGRINLELIEELLKEIMQCP